MKKVWLSGTVLVAAAVFLIWNRTQVEVQDAAQNEVASGTDERSVRVDSPERSDQVTSSSEYNETATLEPPDIARFREQRGYYVSGGNDPAAAHPYESLSNDDLQVLASQGDGLAQLVMADRMANTNLVEAIPTYLEAAANGKTAALINIASGQLVVTNGQSGFGFELTDEDGQVSTRYAEILQYYAAAEILGDFVGSEMLRDHINLSKLSDKVASLERICSLGREIASGIGVIRTSKGLSKELDQVELTSVDTPEPICASRNLNWEG